MSDLTAALRAKAEDVARSRLLVGDSIRAALEVEDISQAMLAVATGLSPKHVNQIITGKVPLSVDVALRMEAALPSLSAEDLMVAQAREQVRKARNPQP